MALRKATRKGSVTVTRLLLANGARITDLAVSGATYSKNPAIFEEFLNHGWDINSTGFGSPALRLVVGDEACVRWFLEHGADPNKQGHGGATSLATAALYPSIVVLELLITYGAKLDPQALSNAINRRGNGGVQVMKYLIDQGIDMNARVKRFSSALHYAVHQAGPPDRVRLLLDNGADRSLRNVLGQTPLEAARERRYRTEDAMNVYEMLLEE